MRLIMNGREVDVPANDEDGVDSDALRQIAGVSEDRPLLLQGPDGENVMVNPGERRFVRPWEISEYFKNVRRVGPLGHVMTDEAFELFPQSGAVTEDPAHGAKDILLLERAKELLIG